MPMEITCGNCGALLEDGINDISNHPCDVCDSQEWNAVITPAPIQLNISPLAFQWYAQDFYEAYKKVKDGTSFSPARLTLLAQAVELAAKSLHVDQGKGDKDLRKIGHDLAKACDITILGLYGITLSETERTELKKLGDLHTARAFAYFWFHPHGQSNRQTSSAEAHGIMHALTGRKNLPNESIVEELLIKLLGNEMTGAK